jgi:hypothetical protein
MLMQTRTISARIRKAHRNPTTGMSRWRRMGVTVPPTEAPAPDIPRARERRRRNHWLTTAYPGVNLYVVRVRMQG